VKESLSYQQSKAISLKRGAVQALLYGKGFNGKAYQNECKQADVPQTNRKKSNSVMFI
jgi:hypothetical protein